MIQILFQVAAAGGLLAGTGDLPEPDPASGTPHRYSGVALDVEITTPSVPSADIRVDGLIDDRSWEHAAVLDGFTQFNPIEGSPASQETEVLVLVDDDALYFAVRAYDDDPSGIRATLSERDSFGFSDDYIRFILDTFDDQRRAYVFTVNP
ncbi:MAG: hypothetical protein R3304_03780, partial [Longimicrobiales bacterium]|nr:hypothetical protein [Longimicrobiales bacterium]